MASMSRAPGRSNHDLCQSGITCRSLIPKHGGYLFSGIIPREGSADMRLSTWTGSPIGPNCRQSIPFVPYIRKPPSVWTQVGSSTEPPNTDKGIAFLSAFRLWPGVREPDVCIIAMRIFQHRTVASSQPTCAVHSDVFPISRA